MVVNTARIRRLSNVLVDRIAAGEVIDHPASVVKELVENAIDAGASSLRIETTEGGPGRIIVEDNGTGIHPEDLPVAIERHATSKVQNLNDVHSLTSYGFRGEALAAIASVSYVEICSGNPIDENQASATLKCRGGEILSVEGSMPRKGTAIFVEDLFYSTPARKKFLKAQRTENNRIYKEIIKLGLANPTVSFHYVRDDRKLAEWSAAENVLQRIDSIFKDSTASHMLRVEPTFSGGFMLEGYVSDQDFFRASRERQYCFVNGRPVEIKNMGFLVKKAYGELCPHGMHPAFFLYLTVDLDRVDVNVHPTKKEVRLLDESSLFSAVQSALRPVLYPDKPLPLPDRIIESNYKNTGKGFNVSDSQTNYDLGLHTVVDKLPAAWEIENKSVTESKFLPVRHFGVIFGTYILAEAADGLYIIDQHTAHERVNYERKRKELEQRKGQTQLLLHPVILSDTMDEIEEILANKEFLKEAGFIIEQVSPTAVALREAPDYLDAGSETDILMHLIQRLAEGEKHVRVYDEYAAMKACKASIKRNDKVAGSVISQIIQELSTCEDPSRCPHGRPTMIRVTLHDLDRMFHRI